MNSEITFGTFVKQHRMTLGLTQAELAARVGCATVTLRKIEGDTLRPSVQISERLAMALNIPLDERGDFVRLARTALLGTPEPPSLPTPTPLPEEIGGEDLTGRAIRGYELGERIGAGGYGAVYRAVQPGVEREVAVKIILPQYANHPDFIRRFEAEAHLVARLEHPHIVPLYDYWREPDAAYLVMRLLRGGSLNQLVTQGPLSLDFILKIFEQVGGALHIAHRFGVIHRDLKPANILLDEDQNAYLADFGIAKNLGNPNLDEQTQAGTWIGSPAYTSPEQIRSEAIMPQADIYCMGVMLFELLTGKQPFRGPTPIDYIMQHLQQPLPYLSEYNPQAPTVLDPVIQRATSKDPHNRYSDIPSMLADLQSVLSTGVEVLDWAEISSNISLDKIENPFKGLRPFGEADASDFFGRNALTQEILSRLGEETDVCRFLAVVGPSGSGKSSVVKAGIIPAIRRGALPGSEKWFVVDFVPGTHPFEELEAALLRVAVNPPESLLGQLKEDERGLVRAVKRILPQDEMVELVLIIDQFEEIFTLLQDEATRTHFLNSLVSVSLDSRSRVRVIITLRADFTDRPLQYVDFGDLVRQRTEFVLPLTPDEMELAIQGPAKKAGLLIEPALTARIVRDLGDQPGTLPLLQYTLTELFDRREEGRKLTLRAYESIGGVLGALGRRAEEVFTQLDVSAQTIARQLFLRLVTLGEGFEDARRRVRQDEVAGLFTTNGTDTLEQSSSAVLTRVLESFSKARLLTFDRDPVTRAPTFEVAHEALLREWPRLKSWLNESRADLRLQRLLAQATTDWMSNQHDSGLLLRGTRLAQLVSWARVTNLALTGDERHFLHISLETDQQREAQEVVRQEREKILEQRSRTFLRGLVSVFALATVVALFLSIFAFNQRGLAQTESNSRATQQAIAQEQAALAADNAEQALQSAQLAATRQAEAETEAAARATAEAKAILGQQTAEVQKALAEEQARLAYSRELVAGAISNLDNDPELSMLLALEAFAQANTFQAQEVLHTALISSRLLARATPGPDETFGGYPWGITFSQDGKLLTNIMDGPTGWVTQVRDAETLEIRFTVPGWLAVEGWLPGGYLPTMDNRKGGEPAEVMIWDFQGQLVKTVIAPQAWQDTEAIGVSPDLSKIAVSNRAEAAVQIINADTTEILHILPNIADSIAYEPMFSPDNSKLLISYRDAFSMTLWDVQTGTELWRIPTLQSYAHAFSPDGNSLAIARQTSIELHDIATGATLQTLRGHTGLISLIYYSADGTKLISSAIDGTVRVWDLESFQNVDTFKMEEAGVVQAAMNPDKSRVVTVNQGGSLRLWGLLPSEHREVFSINSVGACGIAYQPGGTLLAVSDCFESISLWDTLTGQLVKTFTTTKGTYDPTFSLDGSYLAAIDYDDFVIWQIETGEEKRFPTGQFGIWTIALNPDGTQAATIDMSNTARLLDTATGEILFTLEAYTETLSAGEYVNLAFSPDGSQLATSGGTSAKIWDTATGEEFLRLPVPPDTYIPAIAYSPDGFRLAACSQWGQVYVWNAKTGEKIMDLVGLSGPCLDIAYSPDGKYLATADVAATTQVWDADTGISLLTLSTHTKEVIYLTFSSDSKYLADQGHDATAFVYTLEQDELINLALARLTRWFTVDECKKYLHTDTCPVDRRPK